jgi:hypothetical protein
MRIAVLRVKRHLRTLSESPRARRDAARAIAEHRAAMAAGFRQAAAARVLPLERLCRRADARLAA